MSFEMAEDETQEEKKKRSYKQTYRNISSQKLHAPDEILWPGKEYKLDSETAKLFEGKLAKV